MIPAFSYHKLNITEVWLTSWQLYRKTFVQICFLAALIGVLINILLILNLLYPLKFQGIAVRSAIIYVVVHIVIQLLNVYLLAVILHRMHVISDWKKLTLWDSLCYVNEQYSKIIIADFFAYFLVLLGVFFLFAPAVYLFVAFFMIQPLILFDNKGSFAALKDSIMLVKGNWWRSFVILFLPTFAVSNFLYWLIFAVYRFPTQKIWYVLIGCNMLIVTFLFPFIVACILVQFKDLKLRKQLPLL